MTVREVDGDFVVSIRDLPDVVTSGESREEALELAADAIAVAAAARMAAGEDVLASSRLRKSEIGIGLPAPISAKAAVYRAHKASGLKKTELATRMNRNEAEMRRILNPRHDTKLDQLEEAARALGGRLAVSFEVA